ncbi:MAG TPA: peptidase M16 [Cyanobacteria bacterium UBA8803]|nr:peptidase M16 [Cyanobacteria bacterium UBA9273]HBL57531.1 peptidase M16 [Cyanobacteria bacterium UBA8803]
MSVFRYRHRYSLLALLFSFCLSAVLLFSNKVSSTETAVVEAPLPTASARVANLPSPVALTQNVSKTILENGLTILTKEVHTAPVVTVQVWYSVGSRNESLGLNGISHQLEHLLFKGTTNRPIQFGRLLSALGADSNAFTSYDQTAYFGTVERDKLEALLILEADRMQNTLINAEHLASEKRVVISELQGYENDPEYRLDRAVMAATFPNHAYGLPVGGTKADVERFTLEQVKDYYDTYYNPNRATLIIVGDFETASVLDAVKNHFGKIPNRQSSSTTPSPISNAKPAKNHPIRLQEPGSSALLEVVYPLPAIAHPDVPALDVMDYILTSGRSSRLYQALVESGEANSAWGYAANLIEKGWYTLFTAADPGRDLEEIDRILQQIIADVQNQGVTTAELNRAKAQIQASAILSNRDVTSQAFQLGDDQTTAGDYRFTDRYLKAIAQVTLADVQRVAKTYLNPEQRTIGFFEPTQIQEETSSTSSNFSKTSENFTSGPPVDPAEVAQYLPAVVSDAAIANHQLLPQLLTLNNGLRLLLLSDRSTPTVTLSGYIAAGKVFDPLQKSGLADLTATNLMNGTQTKDALTLAQILEDRGADLGFYAVREGTYIGGNTLSKDLPTLIATLSDVLQNATFPNDQLELSRQRTLNNLDTALDDPSYLARQTLAQTIYPDNHPFHSFPTTESIKRITRDDMVRFYQEHYRPDTTLLTLVGDFAPQQVRSLLETQLGNWTANGKPPQVEFPPVELPQKLLRLNSLLPGKSQSVTYLGSKSITRQDPLYYAALVLNQILGGDTLASRLGSEIRDRQGLTYGIYSYFQTGINCGSFLIEMQTAPEDAEKAIASTLSLIQQTRDKGVTAAEVATAKHSIMSEYSVALANPDNLAQTILENQVYGLSLDEIHEFVNQIEAVTLAQVNQAAKELLHPDNLIVVTAGPEASVLR